MTDLLSNFNSLWTVLLMVASGIASVFGWVGLQKKKKIQSTKMLYDELEQLKRKVIIQVSREVEQATELAEKKRIIIEFREHCPDCYESYQNASK